MSGATGGTRGRAGWGIAVTALLALVSAPFLPPYAEDPAGISLEVGLCLLAGLSVIRPIGSAIGLAAVSLAIVVVHPQALGLSVLGFGVGSAMLLATGRPRAGVVSGLLYYVVLLGLGLTQAHSVAEVLQAVGFWTIVFGLAMGAGVGVRRAQVVRHRLSRAHAEAMRDERERMARHLHDTIVRATDRAVQRAEAAQRRGNADEQTLHDLEFIAETCRAAVTDQRRLLEVLHSGEGLATLRRPAPRPAVVLEAALASLRDDGFDARLRCDDDLSPESDAGAAAFADAMREAVANVMAHADRNQPVTVIAARTGATLRCKVINGALQSDFPRSKNGHIGLRVARQRLREAGGSLLSRPKGGGWETLVTIPTEAPVIAGKGNNHD